MAAEQSTFVFAGEEAGADAPEPQQQVSEDRPEWLDEKFESPEAMQQAYHELQQKMGEASEETSSEESGENEESSAEDQGEAVKEFIKPEDLQEFSNEYMEKGELTEETYTKLQKDYGFSKEIVDQFVQGQEALAASKSNSVYSEVGGEEQYNEIVGWAADNLPDADVAAYNNIIAEGNMDSIRLALGGLRAKYASSNPNLISGSGKATMGGYASKAEMIQDMRNPRYKEDPAFRNQVDRKLANTPDGVI